MIMIIITIIIIIISLVIIGRDVLIRYIYSVKIVLHDLKILYPP